MIATKNTTLRRDSQEENMIFRLSRHESRHRVAIHRVAIHQDLSFLSHIQKESG